MREILQRIFGASRISMEECRMYLFRGITGVASDFRAPVRNRAFDSLKLSFLCSMLVFSITLYYVLYFVSFLSFFFFFLLKYI